MNINHDRERSVLAQIYANKADSVKYLPFFFKDKKELRHFFNMFGGKTLILPKTFEEFIEKCLTDDFTIEDTNRLGIDENIHERTKDRIIDTYIKLFVSLEEVLKEECNH